MLKAAFFAALIVAATPAVAAEAGASNAKLTTDIRITESRTRIAAADSGDYIELAQAYLRAGRTGDAVVAYRAALVRDNVMMMSRHGDAVWSHEIARMALGKMPQLASR